jgi:ClpP class serine protease
MTMLLHVADRVLNRPLMILPDKLSLIASVLDGRIGIDGSSLGGTEAEYLKKAAPGGSRFVGNYEPNDPKNPAAGKKPYRTTPEGIAVIGVVGSLVNRGGWIGAYSGMTSYEGFKYQLGAASRDASVSSIILDMDSPGGEAVGAFEAADAVRAAAQIKEVVAVVNGMAASAAYAIASAATRIVTTSSGISGSIGVVMLHADYSKRLMNEGIVPTLIFAGARKVDGNPYEKLTAEVKGELKAEIDRFHDLFVPASPLAARK